MTALRPPSRSARAAELVAAASSVAVVARASATARQDQLLAAGACTLALAWVTIPTVVDALVRWPDPPQPGPSAARTWKR